jgi:16S rRNA (guanine966-N2)-methyltransferase
LAGDAGRVIAGSAAGRRLSAPGPGTRPLSDRVKQTLFAILEPRLPGSRFLDLCAGSGAGGIEALSRGAAHAVLVEQDGRTCKTIAENLARTGLAGPAATVIRAEAGAWLANQGGASGSTSGGAPGNGSTGGPFDLVLVDPPYDQSELLESLLAALGGPAAERLLAADAMVVAKHFWRAAPPARIGLLRSTRERRFGETTLTFYRRAGTEDG